MLDQQQRKARAEKYAKTTSSLKKARKSLAYIRAMRKKVGKLVKQRNIDWHKKEAKRRAEWRVK